MDISEGEEKGGGGREGKGEGRGIINFHGPRNSLMILVSVPYTSYCQLVKVVYLSGLCGAIDNTQSKVKSLNLKCGAHRASNLKALKTHNVIVVYQSAFNEVRM